MCRNQPVKWKIVHTLRPKNLQHDQLQGKKIRYVVALFYLIEMKLNKT